MRNLNRRMFLQSTAVAGLGSMASPSFAQCQSNKPNVIVILVDDMGFSDLGCYGGEIETPNIDRLANNGIQFTQFYNTARCCPTRASILTGQYPHQAGVGGMDSDQGTPEYQGYLNTKSVTIAEALQDYRCYHAGKWHVGREKGHWPLDRGFDRYYGLINGASNFFNIVNYRNPEEELTFLLDDQPFEFEPTTEAMWRNNEGFYMTDAFTDYALKFLSNHHHQQHQDDPFFLYLAYTAPHWPLHAFPEDYEKYLSRYENTSWDTLRQERFERQKALGLFDESLELAPFDDQVPKWEDASRAVKDEFALEMALYAGMIDRMDQNIGRMIGYLEKSGELENTLILFVSDNGGCHTTPEFDHLQGTPGGPNSFPCYGYMGAEVSNTPFRKYKQFIHEGGIATPCIAHLPQQIDAGSRCDQPGHVIDFMPTILDICGQRYPSEYNGNEIQPMRGESLKPAFGGYPINRHDPIYWEHVRNRGVRIGDWKLVAAKPDREWELYNIKEDRTELSDLAKTMPDKKQELVEVYMDWAKRNNVKG